MEKLEEMLDREVEEYLEKVRGMEEVKALLSGEISRESYIKFLKSFYLIEYISRKAVLRVAEHTEETNPYLSSRFISCVRGSYVPGLMDCRARSARASGLIWLQ